MTGGILYVSKRFKKLVGNHKTHCKLDLNDIIDWYKKNSNLFKI